MSVAESSITRFLAEHTLNRHFGEEEFSRLGAFVKLSLIDTTGVAVAAREEPLVQSLFCLLYTSPSPRDLSTSRMPSSA